MCVHVFGTLVYVIKASYPQPKEVLEPNNKRQPKFLNGQKGLESSFFQKRHTNSQQIQEKMISITNHWVNAI